MDHLYRNQTFILAYNPTLKLYGRPKEADRDFRVRCQQAAREGRDAAVDKMRDQYDVKLKRLDDRLARAQETLAQDKAEYKGRGVEEVLSGLSTVAGVLGIFGRRRGLGGLSTAATKRRLTSSTQADIRDTEAGIARLQADVDELKGQMEADADALAKQWAATAQDVQTTKIVPRKTDVDVQTVVLAWAPTWEIGYEDARGRGRADTVAGYSGGKDA